MFKTGYYTKRGFRLPAFGNIVCRYFAFYCLIAFFISSCQNTAQNKEGEQLVASILHDTKLIKSNYSSCLTTIEAKQKLVGLCGKEKTQIKALYKKTKENLSALAALREEGALSAEDYNLYIERINGELKGVRELNHQLKEKGISIKLE